MGDVASHAMLPLLLSLLPALAASLTCLQPCTDVITTDCVTCPEVVATDCTSGELVYGSCGNCQECAKARGEICGGPFNALGLCASNLTCHGQVDDDINSQGICCCPSKTVGEVS